jgi:hypothetical protein
LVALGKSFSTTTSVLSQPFYPSSSGVDIISPFEVAVAKAQSHASLTSAYTSTLTLFTDINMKIRIKFLIPFTMIIGDLAEHTGLLFRNAAYSR